MDRCTINGKFLTQRITGVQRYANEISSRLVKNNSDLSVTAPGRRYWNPVYEAPSMVNEIGGKGDVQWEQLRLPVSLKAAGNPLLLNFCNVAPLNYRNKILCIHDLGYLLHPEFFSKPFYYYYRTIVPRLIKSSRHLLTVSDTSRSDIIRYFGVKESKISVIGNGVSERVCTPGDEPLPENIHGPYYLFIGSFDPRKNLDFLIEAFRSAKLKHTKLVVIGGYSKSFSRQNNIQPGENNKDIIYAGPVSDPELRKYYRHATAVIVPSVYEGFGLPIIEALANGSRVFASDIGIFREIGGDQVTYFNLQNRAELTHLLEKAEMQNIPDNLHMPEMIQKYNWELSASKLGNLIETLV